MVLGNCAGCILFTYLLDLFQIPGMNPGEQMEIPFSGYQKPLV